MLVCFEPIDPVATTVSRIVADFGLTIFTDLASVAFSLDELCAGSVDSPLPPEPQPATVRDAAMSAAAPKVQPDRNRKYARIVGPYAWLTDILAILTFNNLVYIKRGKRNRRLKDLRR